jgi:oligopeptide/dipeptide ABC transporter ATP-binding protein
MNLLDIDKLRVTYGRRPAPPAVDGVSLSVAPGETVGLVGESGSGKTSVANAVLRMAPVSGGRIRYRGDDIRDLRGPALRAFRRRVQMVFQDPFGSLNPRMTVGAALSEVLAFHGYRAEARGRARRALVREREATLLEDVGLDPALAARYPHELSGGQRQRVGIARALAVSPELILADEPVSALDVSVQVQILNLLQKLRDEHGIAFLFIAHDLGVVRYMCPRLLVMYAGRVVESGPTDKVFARPAHPYTEALLAAVPDPRTGLDGPRATRRLRLKGDAPTRRETLAGCPFHPRCHRAQPRCRQEDPATTAVAEGHLSACHFAGEGPGLQRVDGNAAKPDNITVG